jgi:hypothetical protein
MKALILDNVHTIHTSALVKFSQNPSGRSQVIANTSVTDRHRDRRTEPKLIAPALRAKHERFHKYITKKVNLGENEMHKIGC